MHMERAQPESTQRQSARPARPGHAGPPGPPGLPGPSEPIARSGLAAATARPAAAGLVSMFAAAVFVTLRLAIAAHGTVSKLVQAAAHFVNPARAPGGLFVFRSGGYDGQFYYRLALNPLNLHRTAYGITMDGVYRFDRIGYPALAWLGSLGQHALVPAAMVAVNVLAIGCIGLTGGMLARDSGRHPMWGLLLAGYPGYFSAVGRDLTEPVAAACLLAGLLLRRKGRPVLAGLFLGYAALTRETVIAVAAVICLTRLAQIGLRRARPGPPDLAWLIPAAAFGAWQLAVRGVTGKLPVLASFGASGHAGLPFSAFADGLRLNLSQLSGPNAVLVVIWLAEVATLAAFVIAGLFSLRATTAPVSERVAFVAFVLELGVLTGPWLGFADLRQMNEAYLFSVLILLGAPRRHLHLLAQACAITLCLAASYQVLYLTSGRVA
jgi:hypothetical protein